MFENPTVNLNAIHTSCEKDRVLFVSVDVRVSSRGTATYKLGASDSSPVSTFLVSTSLFIQHHQNSTGLRFGDPNIPMSVTIQNNILTNMNVLSHNYHRYYVLEYLYFLLNHSVYYCRSFSIPSHSAQHTRLTCHNVQP